MHVRAAQAVLGDLLAGHRLDHVRAGDEHLRGLADHEHEVGQGGAVGRAARARAEHHADLRDDAGGLGVALEDAAVAGERRDALLDTGARAVVQGDQRGTGRDGHVHDLVDLRGVGLAQRAAEDPEVVGVDEDRPALHRAPAGDHTVGVRLLGLQAEARWPGAGAAARPPGRNPGPGAARCAPGRSACPWRAAPWSPSRSVRPAPAHGSRAVRPPARARRSAHPAPHPKRSCSDLTKATEESGPSTPYSLRSVFLVPLNRTMAACSHSDCSEGVRACRGRTKESGESHLTSVGGTYHPPR